MPGPINQDLINTLVQRELQNKKPAIERPFDLGLPKPPMSQSPLSPEHLATMGAAADIAGTYTGMKFKGYHEGNAMLAGMKPEGVALGLLAQLAAQKGLTHLLRKKMPGVADALAANTGAEQLGLGSSWGRILMDQPYPRSGFTQVNDVKQHGQMAQQMRDRYNK